MSTLTNSNYLIPTILLSCALLSDRLVAATSMLSLGNGSGARNQSISLPLTFSASGNQVSALEWTFAYSTTDFSTISVSVGPSADSAAKNLYCNNTATGQYSCLL